MGCFFPQGVAQGDESDQTSLEGQVEEGLALVGKIGHAALDGRAVHALVFLDEMAAPHHDPATVHVRGNTVSHHEIHLAHARQGESPDLGGPEHGAGHGMAVVLFGSGGQGQHLVFFEAVEGDDVRDLEGSPGEGTRFVEHHGVHLGQGFQGLCSLEEHSLAACGVHGRAHGHGCRQLDGAGVVHREHRSGASGAAREHVHAQAHSEGHGNEAIR